MVPADPVTECALLEYWAARLRGAGYVVIPRERHVVLHASYILTRRELERAPERSFDMALEHNLQCLIRKVNNDGLLLTQRRDLDDPVTGRETVFSTLMAVIKPKASE